VLVDALGESVHVERTLLRPQATQEQRGSEKNRAAALESMTLAH